MVKVHYAGQIDIPVPFVLYFIVAIKMSHLSLKIIILFLYRILTSGLQNRVEVVCQLHKRIFFKPKTNIDRDFSKIPAGSSNPDDKFGFEFCCRFL
jgi:hypothetical protein